MGFRQKGIVKRADLEGQIEDIEVMPITWDECVLIGRTKPLSEVFTPKGGGVKENQVLAVAAVDDNGNPVAWKYTDGGSSSGGKDYRIAETPSGDYAKSYKLQFKGGEDEEWSDAPESFVINVPKDMVVESGSVKTCTEADTPVQGYEVGDKYIDLVIANADDEHIYILVSDLVNNAADGISYDNTDSSLEAENVQEAIDEIVENKADKTEILPTYTLAEYEEIKNTIPVGTTFAISDDVDDIEKYVPVPQVAEVGQVLSVKAVDENGRPTEWECVNGGSDGDNKVVYFRQEGDEATISYANAFGSGTIYIPVTGFFWSSGAPQYCFGYLSIWVGGAAMDHFQVFYITGTSSSNTTRNSTNFDTAFTSVVDIENKTITLKLKSTLQQYCFTFM